MDSPMKKWKIGIDIDGTVTDPATFIPHLNQAFNKALQYEEITQYHLPPLFGISDEEFMTWFEEHEGSIYSKALLAERAKDVLDELFQIHHLVYISARNERYHQLTLEWFKQHEIPYHHIDLLGSHNKIEIAKSHAIELFFEDKFDNANDLAEELAIPVILFNTPYNQGNLHKDVTRVNHWQEARDVLRNYLK
jgi:uncharacterized HAD superfamily protein